MRYEFAPLVDAIIELRFEQGLKEDVKQRVVDAFAHDYELIEEKVQQTVNVELTEGQVQAKIASGEKITKRTRTESPDIVQIGDHIFSVARGAPYENWEQIASTFKEAFEKSKRIWGYRKLIRIGARFINRIDLEMTEDGSVRYEDYLNLRINLPDDFPNIAGYSLSFESPHFREGFNTRVQSGVVEPAIPGHHSFVLDVDVWTTSEIPQKKEKIFETLDELREMKNALFETFITDKARELFRGK